MAIDKGKVKARLLVKYQGKSLTTNFIEKLAEKYADKIETDDDEAIDAFINEQDYIVQETISESDRRVTSAVNKVKKPEQQQQQQEQVEPTEEAPEGTPEWAKGLFKTVNGLAKDVTSIKTEKTVQTLTERFLKDERLKGIDPKLLKGRYPTTDEEFETAVSEAAEDLKDFVTDEGSSTQQQQGVKLHGKDRPGFSGKPNGGGGNGANKQASKEELDAVTKGLGI